MRRQSYMADRRRWNWWRTIWDEEADKGDGSSALKCFVTNVVRERWTCCGLHADSWFLSALFPRLATICVREGGRERERKDFNQIDFKISIKILYINSLSFLIIICRWDTHARAHTHTQWNRISIRCTRKYSKVGY